MEEVYSSKSFSTTALCPRPGGSGFTARLKIAIYFKLRQISKFFLMLMTQLPGKD
jgi:hypothetical protein